MYKECVAVLIGLHKKNGAVSCVGFDFVLYEAGKHFHKMLLVTNQQRTSRTEWYAVCTCRYIAFPNLANVNLLHMWPVIDAVSLNGGSFMEELISYVYKALSSGLYPLPYNIFLTIHCGKKIAKMVCLCKAMQLHCIYKLSDIFKCELVHVHARQNGLTWFIKL